MADNWIAVRTGKRNAWDIAGVAQAALALIEDAGARTAVAVAQCDAAFEALEDCMRDFKRRYFIKPPLADADFVSLGLKPPGRHHTPVPAVLLGSK
jgi:hypothetical protein